MMRNILLTSAGGLVGTYLIKHFKETGDCRIIAVDSSEYVPARTFADVFYKVPATIENGYWDCIQGILEKERCDAMIPVTSYDVTFFAAHPLKDRKLLVMERKWQSILSNKETAYHYLEQIGIRTPNLYEEGAVVFPCVIKPQCSTGSKNTEVLHNEGDLKYYSKKIQDFILTEYLPGDEYTVDCLFNWEGRCLGYNVRQRQKTVSGGAVISKNCFYEDVEAIIQKLEDTGHMVGPINFQYKRDVNGEAVVFDFNTRLPSGGLPLTVQSGFDIPNLMLDLLCGETPAPWNKQAEIDGLTMIRYYEEVFCRYENGVL